MEKFKDIYPFTTENIAGYMDGIDMNGRRVITVTGSGDHVINAIRNGTTEITTFDVNPLTKYYLELKLAGIQELSLERFLKVFLYNSQDSFSYEIIRDLPLREETRKFWLDRLRENDNKGLDLKRSDLFHLNYFRVESVISKNLYLDKKSYRLVKRRIRDVKIDYQTCNITELNLDSEYDFMFLSNISDYLNLIYDKDYLLQYRELIMGFLEYVKKIYFAYIYDIGTRNPRSAIDYISKVKEVFGKIEIETFKSALEDEEKNKRDGVLILRRSRNVRK